MSPFTRLNATKLAHADDACGLFPIINRNAP